jgi:hypothetical protein
LRRRVPEFKHRKRQICKLRSRRKLQEILKKSVIVNLVERGREKVEDVAAAVVVVEDGEETVLILRRGIHIVFRLMYSSILWISGVYYCLVLDIKRYVRTKMSSTYSR